jgi:hypothetical protein
MQSLREARERKERESWGPSLPRRQKPWEPLLVSKSVRVTCRLERFGAFACRIEKLSYEKTLNLVANQSNISSEIKV